MLVVSRTSASSSRATTAIEYGGSNAGSHWCEFTVKPATVARPETGVGSEAALWHFGQIGAGGCT
jgi:hypothetical protein